MLLQFLVLKALNGFAVDNPVFPEQFYLHNTGQNFGSEGEDINVIEAYDSNYTGTDITIGLYASPCNDEIPSLRGRVAEKCSPVPNLNHSDCSITYRRNRNIGTQLASIIAGNKDSDCCLGIAYNSTLYCKNFLERENTSITNDMITAALTTDLNIQIKSFPLTSDYPGKTINVHTIGLTEYEDIAIDLFFKGRGGLGTVAVFTPETINGIGVDPNFRYVTQTKFPINIAASTNRGKSAYYSPKSSNYIVNVPSTHSDIFIKNESVVTNPIHSANDDGTCGISAGMLPAANAIATGGIALILQKNPFIQSRVLQLVLELSASINDANHSSWMKNAAGISYSNIYGFGRLNVKGALELLDTPVFKRMPPELFNASRIKHPNATIPSCMQAPLIIRHTVKRRINFVEVVSVGIITSHHNIGDLRIELTSPSGTTAVLSDVSPTADNKGDYRAYCFTARQFLGEPAGGNWDVKISAPGCIPTGRVFKTVVSVSGMKGFGFNNTRFDPFPPNLPPEVPVLFGRKDIGRGPPHLNAPIIDSIHKDIFPSNNISYPESEEIKFGLKEKTKIVYDNYVYSFYFTCIDKIKNMPAVLYIKKALSKEPIMPIYFSNASKIDGYVLSMPIINSTSDVLQFVVEVIESPTSVHLKTSDMFLFKPSRFRTKQYEVIKRNQKNTVQYHLSQYSSSVYVSLMDYDRNILLAKEIKKNEGFVDIEITDPEVKRCILTVNGANSGPCDMFIKTIYVDEKIDDFNFPLNQSTMCDPIADINYTSPPEDFPEIITAAPIIPNTRTIMPPSATFASDSSDEGVNFKEGTVTIIIIASSLVVFAVIGALIVVIKCKQRQILETEDYLEAEKEKPSADGSDMFIL